MSAIHQMQYIFIFMVLSFYLHIYTTKEPQSCLRVSAVGRQFKLIVAREAEMRSTLVFVVTWSFKPLILLIINSIRVKVWALLIHYMFLVSQTIIRWREWESDLAAQLAHCITPNIIFLLSSSSCWVIEVDSTSWFYLTCSTECTHS